MKAQSLTPKLWMKEKLPEKDTPMLQSIEQWYGAKLGASDGDIGRVKDFYFDDRNWAVRYVVADTGSWLSDRKVLISPHALAGLDQAIISRGYQRAKDMETKMAARQQRTSLAAYVFCCKSLYNNTCDQPAR